jgi:hypothetical protein
VMSMKMSTIKPNRLRCTQCSKTYKEVKLLNRHRREKHSQEKRWPCEYPGCSIDFQCLRFKNEHVKKQHADQTSRHLLPDEHSRHGFQSDLPGSMAPTPSDPSYEYPYAVIIPQSPTTGAPETPRLPCSLMVDESLSMPTAAGESPPRPYRSFDGPASLQEQRAIVLNDSTRHPEHPQLLGADRAKSIDRPSVAPPRESQSNPALDHPGYTSGVPEAFAGPETAIEVLSDPEIEHTQAIITAIWDRDIVTLSKIIKESEIDSKFGEAATFGLFEKLMENTTGSKPNRQVSHKALAEQSLLDSFAQMLRHLTPVNLASFIDFSDGIICLVSRQNRSTFRILERPLGVFPRDFLRDPGYYTSPNSFFELEPSYLWEARFFRIPLDASTSNFLGYHDHCASSSPFSKLELPYFRELLTSCCFDANNDMPGGSTWLEHATRLDKAAAVYVLLERGADRNTVIADGTPLADFALQNGRDTIAVLLLSRLVTKDISGHPYRPYRHRILDNAKTGRDGHESQGAAILKRLKFAAEAMGDGEGSWDWSRRERLEDFVDKILWAEDRIRRKTSHQFIDEDLGFRISHLL